VLRAHADQHFIRADVTFDRVRLEALGLHVYPVTIP
jgi:hypothetical protein